MGQRLFVALCVVVLALGANSSEARYFDRWGFRLGTGKALGSNTSDYVKRYEMSSRALAINGAFILEPSYNLWIEFSTELRYREWGTGRTNVGYDWSSAHEIAPAISILYCQPLPESFNIEPFLQLGIERNFWQPFYDSYRYSYYDGYRRDELKNWSWFCGCGVVVPVGIPEFVLSMRYNEDLTDGFDPNKYFTPPGSRFSEIHYLFGMNFNVGRRE